MSVLASIIEGVREDLAARRLPMSQLLEAIEVAPPVRDCLLALLTEEISVIAEVKRSSPSKGALAPITDPASLAANYEKAGATTIAPELSRCMREEIPHPGPLGDTVETVHPEQNVVVGVHSSHGNGQCARSVGETAGQQAEKDGSVGPQRSATRQSTGPLGAGVSEESPETVRETCGAAPWDWA